MEQFGIDYDYQEDPVVASNNLVTRSVPLQFTSVHGALTRCILSRGPGMTRPCLKGL